jgi:hypothetical protein
MLFSFCENFVTLLSRYDDELLAPHPTPMLVDHPLLAVRHCLINISAANLHIWGMFLQRQPEGAP